MKIALTEIKHLFLTSLLLALCCHLTMAALITFTMQYQHSPFKPQMTFLGSILSPHDLSFNEYPQKIVSIPTFNDSALNLGPASGFHQRQISPTTIKPVFTQKIISKEKIIFKPPEELFITESSVGSKEAPKDKEANPPIPPRDPLKLNKND